MAKELAEIISEEVDRTNSLVTRFLDFARPLEPRKERRRYRSDRARRAPGQCRDRTGLPELNAGYRYRYATYGTGICPPDPECGPGFGPGSPVTVRVRQSDTEDEVYVSVIDRGCGIPPDKIETISIRS